MTDVYYQNNYSQKLDFMADPYRIFDADFLDYDWEYDSSYNSGSFGGKISSFYRKIVKFNMELAISSSSRDGYKQARDYFLEVAEKDILNCTPGRLYVGDYYLTCYLYASSKSEWQHMSEFMANKVKIVTEYPAWCRDTKVTYSQNTTTDTEDDFPHDYPYDYLSALQASQLVNGHYAACNFIMYIYGPCENPSIFIGSHQYQVNTSVGDGDYLTIDSRQKEIYLCKKDGSRESRFNDRNKSSDVFQAIPPGQSNVAWNGEFWFDIVLVAERSEPEWTT